MKNANRDALNDLGLAYGMVQAAHYTIRSNMAAGNKYGVDAGARQLFLAIENYTKVLDASLEPINTKLPSQATAEEMTARIRSKVVGRIKSGRWVKEEE